MSYKSNQMALMALLVTIILGLLSATANPDSGIFDWGHMSYG